MTGSLLTLVREKQAQATREALEHYRKGSLPRRKRDRDRLAHELNQLIAEQAARSAADQEMVRNLIQEARDRSPEQVDHVNDFLQQYLGVVLGVCGALRGLADKLTEAGARVEGVESLDATIAERERWREDLPEQLGLASRPARRVFEKRIAHALETPPKDTDWRSLFK